MDEYKLYEVDFDGEIRKLPCCNFRAERGWYLAKREVEDPDLTCSHCTVELLAGIGFLSHGKYRILQPEGE